MLLTGVIIFATLMSAALVVLIIGINNVRNDIHELNTKLDTLTSLSLNPRTRIGQATMQSGATTEEQKATRVGRASVARRVVVGGEDDSEQKRSLVRGLREATDG